MITTPLVLHVWPGRWDLHSVDASCLEVILSLQLAFPGQYSLTETANPDLSPTGQLPFLTHGQIVVSSLPSILSYISSLDNSLLKTVDSLTDDEDLEIDPPKNANLDAELNALQLSQRAAWRAYIEAQLGDLVAHSFYVLEPNFAFTHGILASMLPIPQRYYVPRRIREAHRPRLEAVGLWQVANEVEESEPAKKLKGENKEEKIRRAFGQAKLVEKARLVFDLLSRLLTSKAFIFTDRPTSVDFALASRILLLAHAPLPNPALKDLLTASYPSLISHATHIHALAFPASPSASNPPPLIHVPPRVNPFNVLTNSLTHLVRTAMISENESEEAKRFRRYRWGWIALAVAGAVGYIATQGLTLAVVNDEDGADEEADSEVVGEDEGDELLDDEEV